MVRASSLPPWFRQRCTAPIAHFISLELLGALRCAAGLSPTLGNGPLIAVLWIESVIDLALKVVGPMKPRTSANEDAAIKPFRTVVAVGNAVIRGVVIVTIGAIGGDSDID